MFFNLSISKSETLAPGCALVGCLDTQNIKIMRFTRVLAKQTFPATSFSTGDCAEDTLSQT